MRAKIRDGDAGDRRRFPRRSVRYVHLILPVDGRVVDIGRTGMKVETDCALSVGSRTYFLIGRPPQAVARLRGLVRWCRFDGSRPAGGDEARAVFHAGIAFLGLDGELPGRGEDGALG